MLKRHKKNPIQPVTADELIRVTAKAGASSEETEPQTQQKSLSTLPAASASTAAIVCDNLVKIYKIAELEVFALQGLDLVISRGELLGIIGASGSGKSTLMNILGALTGLPQVVPGWMGSIC